MSKRLLPLLWLCLLLFSSCATSDSTGTQITPVAAQPGSDLPSPTTQNLPGLLQTEQLLLMTPLAANDPVQLAQRLKLHTGQLPSRVNRTKPLNLQVGQEDSFWLQNQDTAAYSQIRARLEYATAHVYMYVEDGQPFNSTALQLSTAVFEQQIYPTERANGESEWTPGIDGDAHITILNAVGLGNDVSGLFRAQNEYPVRINAYSNAREMLYINLDGEIPGSADYNATLASTFQQLINWHEHPLTSDWMNEGLAILAQHLNTYSTNGVDQAFLKTPDIQLNDWSADPAQETLHAGASYLFLDYFVGHYGGPTILKELLQDPALPPTNFDNVLTKNGYKDRFTDVLNRWLVANLIADPSIDTGEYGYPDVHLPGVTPQHEITAYPLNEADQVSQYAAEYYDLHPHAGKAGTLTIQLRGAPTVRLMGNDPLDTSEEWWGNRADNMDSTLTRSFDLTTLKGHRATLSFATWFDLQQNHDYAYAEISSDGGINWASLKGNFTTSDDPNGLNLGNGYTGISGGGDTPAWVQETIDLTPYTGKKVQLRFEEVTDNSIALQGFALDQIRIPELQFQDTVATDNGWVSQGFIRTSNILPEHYRVQAVVYTGTTTFTISTMNVDLASGQGSLTFPYFGSEVTRVVLIVSAYALDTTLQAHYQLEIHAS
jgi:hypothetical protein